MKKVKYDPWKIDQVATKSEGTSERTRVYLVQQLLQLCTAIHVDTRFYLYTSDIVIEVLCDGRLK